MAARFLTTTESIAATLATTDGNQYPVAPAPGGTGPIVVPPLYSVVLRPGDTSGDDNVFTSWSALYAACSAIDGGVRVAFDDTHGAIHVTAGTWDVDGWVWVNGAPAATAIIDVGAHLTYRNLFLDAMTITVNATADVYSAPGSAGFVNLYILDGTILTCTTTGRFLSTADAGGQAFVTIYPSCGIGDGTNAVFHGFAGSTFETFQSGGQFANNAQSGGTLDYDSSVSVDATSANFPGVTFFPTSRLALVATNNNPTAVPGAALGTGGTVSVSANSNDAAGVVTMTKGTGNTAGAQAVITFSQPYTSPPRAVLFCAADVNAASGIASGTEFYPTAVSATGFTLSCVNGIIPASVEYAYLVVV